MDEKLVYNLNVVAQDVLPTPEEIKRRVPLTDKAEQTVLEGRFAVERILDRKDHRFIVVVGPCSIHDPAAAMDYAQRLKRLADEVSDTLYVVMRVYFEKPRTTTGWKGLINDPHMNDSFHIEEGLQKARQVLLDINELGLPAGTEALDPISPQYLGDLVTWSAIGARTTESQTHREMASGLSTPVGFKNGTDGGLQVAINALLSVSNPHSFLGINQAGQVAVIRTKGNRYGHIVLRGGSKGPELRLGDHRAGGKRAGQEQAAGQYRRGLQSRQLQQGSFAAAAGDERRGTPDHGRQPIDSRRHAGEQYPRGQSVDSGGPVSAQVWRVGDGRLHRLGHDGKTAARFARKAQRRTAAPDAADRRDPIDPRLRVSRPPRRSGLVGASSAQRMTNGLPVAAPVLIHTLLSCRYS